MWLPDAHLSAYALQPYRLRLAGRWTEQTQTSFAIIKPCYTQKPRLPIPSLAAPAKPRPQRLHATAAAKPLTLACRRRRGSVKYGADQVPMTCIHDSHLHAATLIRRTYMEFGDATGCSISSPLPLGCPEARPRGHARTIVARLDIWHRDRTTKRLNLGRGVGQIKIGMLPHTAL
ncbi:uncharacterized protein TrAFT101_000979 [Trichoderma asperellum]|uniref:uncharacterized protein n=1 Tax=Trichoderma asperellum TaxID=101201 RepID=UPI003323CA60|nr:hypothetical protein TrAFT101_000979 [Trichoderma asperellum]